MQNIQTVEIESVLDGQVREHVIITNEDGSVVSMLKSIWDEQQAKQTEGGLI